VCHASSSRPPRRIAHRIMSDEVSSFLRDVEQLKGRRTEEDEARSRELEEKILQERRERQARREGTQTLFVLPAGLCSLPYLVVARAPPPFLSLIFPPLFSPVSTPTQPPPPPPRCFSVRVVLGAVHCLAQGKLSVLDSRYWLLRWRTTRGNWCPSPPLPIPSLSVCPRSGPAGWLARRVMLTCSPS
jgi:hypothetical protein